MSKKKSNYHTAGDLELHRDTHDGWIPLTLISRQSQIGCDYDCSVVEKSSLDAFAGITKAEAFCRGAEPLMRMGNDASTIQSLPSAVFKTLLKRSTWLESIDEA